MSAARPTLHQIKMLQFLQESRRPAREQQVDGRVAKALVARGWAVLDEQGVSITNQGRGVLTGLRIGTRTH